MTAINDLLVLMARLRDPDSGCPWDLEQTFATIAPYTIEEAYEVADAVEQNDMAALKDELGDLLLQIVFHAQMAKERGLFDFADVARHVTGKMVSRHPHVFGDAEAKRAADVESLWEDRKDLERKRLDADSILDDVTRALPALMRAQKLQKRAARVGFEWARPVDVLDKLEEEAEELRQALQSGVPDDIEDELGDMFFVLANFGRMLDLDCETALRRANAKFERRFRHIETALKSRGAAWKNTTLAEMETLWDEAKGLERRTG